MSRDVGAMPSFHESGFNHGLDPAQIAKNDQLLTRFQGDRVVYRNVKKLLGLIGGDLSKNSGPILSCLIGLRDHGVDFFPEIDYSSSEDFGKEDLHRVVDFLRNNCQGLTDGTYKNEGELIPSGRILNGDNDLIVEEKFGPYVRKVMPGVDIRGGTYPRRLKSLELMITRGDEIDHKGVKIVSKGFAFMYHEFLPKLEQALQYFLSSRSEAIFVKMMEVRNGFDRVLARSRVEKGAQGMVEKKSKESSSRDKIDFFGNSQVPPHWVEEYKIVMHQVNLMYAVYDKLRDAIFRLGPVVEGGSDVESQIEMTRDRFLLPLLSAHSSMGPFASLGDGLPRGEGVSEDGRSKLELQTDFEDYMTDARGIMIEISDIVAVYMKALMHSGVHGTHPEDVMEIEEFLK